MADSIKVSFDFMLERDDELSSMNFTMRVSAEDWRKANAVEKLKPALKTLREHRPFKHYRIINVSQTIID